MLDLDYFPYFKAQLRLNSFIKTSLFKWNFTTDRLECLELNKKTKLLHQFGMILIIIRTALMLWNASVLMGSKNTPGFLKMAAVSLMIAFVAMVGCNLSMKYYRRDLCLFVNTLKEGEILFQSYYI